MTHDWAATLGIQPALSPPLDPEFLPASLFSRACRNLASGGGRVLRFGLERPGGFLSVHTTTLPQAAGRLSGLDLIYSERTMKFLLWQRGACRVLLGGPREIGDYLRSLYCRGGAREFDFQYFSDLYERPLTLDSCSPRDVPDAEERTVPLGRHFGGCRVGFDLGASDRKACALVDGEVVYSEEVPWDPRHATDPEYHYREIMDSIRRAASALPRLDAVGGSAAGVYVQNRVRSASLFRGIPQSLFEKEVAGLFLRIRDELGVPLQVMNDGEVTALAGSISLGKNPVLGIAMGSSQAAGYVNAAGALTGWLNELAFAPVDYRADGPVDEWSGDRGCGVQYFSQVGAIRVAENAGMRFAVGMGLPEKLLALQQRMRGGDARARRVYETIGIFLGYAAAHYAEFYNLGQILVLGRVTTGPGGEVMLQQALEVLQKDFPELAGTISFALPDEASRRVGQAIAAASLPEVPGIS